MITRQSIAPFIVFAFMLGATAPSLAEIHPGDTLFVKVWNHPELSKQVTVDAAGAIRVPLSGSVIVTGLSEQDAAKKLADSLRPYVVYPAVDLETLDQGKAIFVAGGPVGELVYKPGETLTGAVADALQGGGANSQVLNEAGQSTSRDGSRQAAERARIDLRRVVIERDEKPYGSFDTIALNASGNPGPMLVPGDTIVFTYKPIAVRVLGSVAVPGPTYLSSDQSLSEAISQAGGLLPTSVTNHLILTRGDQTRTLALGDPIFQAPAQPGDVITVPQAPRVTVLGTVVTPGIVSLKADSSLLSAMYTAGGPTKYSNLRNVQVLRGTQRMTYDVTDLTHGDMSKNPELQDGDTVVVPEGHYFDPSGVLNILGGIVGGLATRL